MRKRLLATLVAGLLSGAAEGCYRTSEEEEHEAARAREEAVREAREGDVEEAREELREAAEHEAAAARRRVGEMQDSTPSDTTIHR